MGKKPAGPPPSNVSQSYLTPPPSSVLRPHFTKQPSTLVGEVPSFSEIVEGPQVKKTEKAQSKKGRVGRFVCRFLVLLLFTGLVAGGIYLVYAGQQEHVVQEIPLPEKQFTISPDQAEALAKQNASADADKDGADSSVAGMPAPSLYIPSQDRVAPIVVQGGFEDSKYRNFQTLVIPKDPKTAAWFSGGAPLWGGEQGTTLVASHYSASHNRVKGVFRKLYKLKAGDVLWTKDAAGHKQSWAVHKVWYADHKKFPQDYFKADGPRQLVVTTCGGRLNSRGYFAQNVFVVATPVNLPGSTPYVKPVVTPEYSSTVESGGNVTTS